jgi:DNA polymerase elongation subunit (family B)
MTRIFLDLETQALPQDQLQKFMPKDDEWPLGNARKPDTVARIIEEKKAEWIDQAALSAITGQIIAVAVGVGENLPPICHVGEELHLINLALAHLETITPCYTWNGSVFDLPFLCQRAAVYGIPAFNRLTTMFRGRRYWNENLIDGKQVWSMYSSDHRGTSLAKVALALGVGEKNGNGKAFSELLKTDRDRAIEYAKNDVVLLRKIVQAMGI